MHTKTGAFSLRIDPNDTGKRLDLILASYLPNQSRSYFSHLITTGRIKVRGCQKKPSYKVQPGDVITGQLEKPAPAVLIPEPMDLDILWEDESLIVINKPPGMVVHPSPGHRSGTLVNGLLHHDENIGGVGDPLRPGIVHRLDKDTSGIMVVAKTSGSYDFLLREFKQRRVNKQYLALVCGVPSIDNGEICSRIGRHPTDRKKMSTRSVKSRSAKTSWRVKERFAEASLLELHIHTGRTHQIRVHCADMNHPVVGDPKYGRRKFNQAFNRWCRGVDSKLAVTRQMLHAYSLSFSHPRSRENIHFKAPLPRDMKQVLEILENPLIPSP
jgi:23S rRNA pseudouridine1911/1915/1917 synthase